MTCQEVQSWTLGGLTGAFLDLVLAYFLLCISAFVFFVSKLLTIFWVYLPCPCNGFFGYRNCDLCLHKLLNDWPLAKIYAVQKLVKSRFPFDIRFKDQTCNLNQKLIRDVNSKNGVLELEAESCSSPFSSPRLQSLVDKESGYDAKGKRIVILKKRAGIRRSRRDSLKSPRIFPFPLDERDTRETTGESSTPVAAREDEPQATEDDIGKIIRGCSKLNGSAGESKGLDIHYGQEKFSIVENETDTIRMLQEALEIEKAACAALYLELEKERAAAATAADEAMAMICRGCSKLNGSAGESKGLDIHYGQEKFSIVENETDTIRMLQEALEIEKAACAALYLELEKERAAAATAADEAMAMICRLQKDKASTEMEVRQYQRMIEEKFVYDEEEMDILKEILLRREKENHFLEKEVEAYRQMNSLGNELSNGDSNDKLCEWGKPSLYSNLDSQLMMPRTNDTKSNRMEMGNIADSTSQFEASLVEKQIHSNGHDFVEKSVLSTWEEKLQTDHAMCQGLTTEALQSDTGIDKNFYCDGEELQQDGDLKSNFHSAVQDTEPAVHDIHVIDGKTEILKGESRSSIYAALDGFQDSTCGASGVCSNLQPMQSMGKGKTPL